MNHYTPTHIRERFDARTVARQIDNDVAMIEMLIRRLEGSKRAADRIIEAHAAGRIDLTPPQQRDVRLISLGLDDCLSGAKATRDVSVAMLTPGLEDLL
jgi:hypothetical protein